MVNRIGAVPRIKGITVCQEGDAAQFFNDIRYGFYIVRPKERQVTQFTKVHLDGNELMVKINFVNSCSLADLLQLFGLANTEPGSEIGKKYICFFHIGSP